MKTEKSTGWFNGLSPATKAAIAGGMALVAGIAAGCSKQSATETVAAPTSIAMDQDGQNAQTGDQSTAPTQEGMQELSDLKNQINLELGNLTDEEVVFVKDAYAGPDSLAPKLLTNLANLKDGSSTVQNWNALIVNRLSSENPQVVKDTIDYLGITPQALQSYYDQAKDKLNAVGGANYTSLTPEDNIASDPDSASKLHAHALMLALDNVLTLVNRDDVRLATNGLTKKENNFTEFNDVTIDGKIEPNPTTVQIKGSEVVVGDDLPMKGVDSLNIDGLGPIDTYVATVYTGIDDRGALILFARTGYREK